MLHMFTKVEDSSLIVPEKNCDTNLALKDRNWTNKGVRFSIPQYNNSLSMCIQSFSILALKVPEKTQTQILMLTCYIGKEIMMDEK